MANDSFVSLYTTTLATATSSVTISGIPTTGYRDLRLVFSGSFSSSAQMNFNLNGDSSSKYSYLWSAGRSNNSAQSYGEANLTSGYLALTPSTSPSVVIVDFLDSGATNKFKTSIARNSNGGNQIDYSACRWASTSAVNTINISMGAGNFTSGSVVSLFGIVG